jgi:hypothetical protein
VFEAFAPLIAPPVLPATILLFLVAVWSLLTVLLGFGGDHSWFHGHVDPSSGIDHDAASGWLHDLVEGTGATILTPIRWLNLNSVPIFIWFTVFALIWWALSITLWLLIDIRLSAEPGTLLTLGLMGKNLAIALPATKFSTNPLRNLFKGVEGITSKSLIGEEAEIWSYDATSTHGQARYKTDGAPLLLNVRTDGPTLVKGTRVWITHYDNTNRIYIVSATTTDLFSPSHE